jgi:D-arginine dehydrogenase
MMHFTTLEVRRAPRAWGGLRSFARDRLPVFGFDDRAAAPFFWFAGQGGAGIQTAPANAELAEALILGAELPNFATGDLVTGVSPKRFAQ